jgi:hypothetical protein
MSAGSFFPEGPLTTENAGPFVAWRLMLGFLALIVASIWIGRTIQFP